MNWLNDLHQMLQKQAEEERENINRILLQLGEPDVTWEEDSQVFGAWHAQDYVLVLYKNFDSRWYWGGKAIYEKKLIERLNETMKHPIREQS